MKVRCKVVNSGLAGEPEHIVYQNQETNEIIELDTITRVLRDEYYEEPNVESNLHYVLNNMGHYCEILYNDNGLNKHTLILEQTEGERNFPLCLFISNIFRIFVFNKNMREMISDNLDYDGMGNFGRFPSSEKK